MNRFLPAAALAAAVACSSSDVPPPAPVGDPLAYADPRMGSGGFAFAAGNAFPGAATPNGMVKVGPDTSGPDYGTIRFLHYSGYWAGDDTVLGFSHLHLSGTGATDYGVLSVMPLPAFDPAKRTVEANASHFAKASEAASPGSYALTLDNGSIRSEFTATTHSAHHRYTFGNEAPARFLLVDLAHRVGSGKVDSAEATLDASKRRITGKLHNTGEMSGGFGGYDLFFVLESKQPWKRAQVWKKGAEPAEGSAISGTDVGLVLELDAPPSEPVELQVGVSFLSLAGAERNLQVEQPERDFAKTRSAAEKLWRERLQTIRAFGGSEDDRRMLYSALHHAYVMPSITSDSDGRFLYAGKEGQADGWHFVTELSLWDTYRTLHPLYDLLAPDRSRDTVRSLHAMAQLGGFYPRWPIATGESGTMVGSSADVVIADAYVKGIRDFDAADVWNGLRAAALDETAPEGGRGGRANGAQGYLRLGYVPYPEANKSVSVTNEYATDDFALANLAEALGHTADAAKLRERSLGYRKLFDPATGFLRGKDEHGALRPGPFSELEWNEDYTEANAWHSLWGAPHDTEGLAQLFGGKDEAVAKLEQFFQRAKADDDERRAYTELHPEDLLTMGRERPYFWAANEPDIHAAYMFAQLGRPDLTQQWVPWIMRAFYAPTPDGLPGNDDGGTMSAWWIFSALGLYPLPGSDQYILGAPLFPKVELQREGGIFTIEAQGVSAENHFVQSVSLDGAPVTKPALTHAQLKAGSTLRFVMGKAPSSWGR